MIKAEALKPQDIVVACKIFSYAENPRPGSDYTLTSLSDELGLSAGEVHNCLARARKAQLLVRSKEGEIVARKHLHEILTIAVPRFFYPVRGGVEMGMGTGVHAKPLSSKFASASEKDGGLPFVWSTPRGSLKGQSIAPLYPSVPEAARRDQYLYELLALIDVIRLGDWKSRQAAIAILDRQLLKSPNPPNLE